MKKILILGSDGMLGHTVSRVFSVDKSLKITKTSRRNDSLDISSKLYKIDVNNFEELVKIIEFDHFDYVINCIGVIKPKIDELDNLSVLNAINVNSLFPLKLCQLSDEHKFRVIQIATDCVYSGESGDYDEKSVFDPLDVYGKTKSLGEPNGLNFVNLRTSIIGKENQTTDSLIEWFLGQSNGAVIKGFKNHLWNGITTLSFAQVVKGIILEDDFQPGTSHLVPADRVSKFELLNLLKVHSGRSDIEIQEFETTNKVDRTLSTINIEDNKKLWNRAGYREVPTISKLIEDYFKWI
jgi:dTDP-4-dehydrorhamnose reductase